MRIVVQVSGYYDWEPIPADVKVTKADIDSQRVRPAAGGWYTMRVPKTKDTATEIHIPEKQLIAKMVYAYCENGKCGTILTRAEAVAQFLATHVAPQHFHRKWVKSFEVHDDGPDENLFKEHLAPHLESKHGRAPGMNVDPEDYDEMLASYMTPCDAAGHVDNLYTHFKVKKPATEKVVSK